MEKPMKKTNRELRTAPLAFRVRPSVKETMARVARARNQSVMSCIELAMMQFIARESRTAEEVAAE